VSGGRKLKRLWKIRGLPKPFVLHDDRDFKLEAMLSNPAKLGLYYFSTPLRGIFRSRILLARRVHARVQAVRLRKPLGAEETNPFKDDD